MEENYEKELLYALNGILMILPHPNGFKQLPKWWFLAIPKKYRFLYTENFMDAALLVNKVRKLRGYK